MNLDHNDVDSVGRRDQPAHPEAKGVIALHEKLDRFLSKAKPTKRELTLQHFRDLYPRIEAHLDRGKLLRDVISAFNEVSQSKVCARKFNEMLSQERARREQNGDPICCRACGRPLPTDECSGAESVTVDGMAADSSLSQEKAS